MEPTWILVPQDPTPAMSAAGFVVSEAEHDPAGVYRAMLAAAPTPPRGQLAETSRLAPTWRGQQAVSENRTVLQKYDQMCGCICTFQQYTAGDGCGVCNPAKALEAARKTIVDLQANCDMLAAMVMRLRDELAEAHQLARDDFDLRSEQRDERDTLKAQIERLREAHDDKQRMPR